MSATTDSLPTYLQPRAKDRGAGGVGTASITLTPINTPMTEQLAFLKEEGDDQVQMLGPALGQKSSQVEEAPLLENVFY